MAQILPLLWASVSCFGKVDFLTTLRSLVLHDVPCDLNNCFYIAMISSLDSKDSASFLAFLTGRIAQIKKPSSPVRFKAPGFKVILEDWRSAARINSKCNQLAHGGMESIDARIKEHSHRLEYAQIDKQHFLDHQEIFA